MILAEIFVYVRSHAHVRLAIPDEPLGGPFSAIHASVVYMCKTVLSHICPHAYSCAEMQGCSVKWPFSGPCDTIMTVSVFRRVHWPCGCVGWQCPRPSPTLLPSFDLLKSHAARFPRRSAIISPCRVALYLTLVSHCSMMLYVDNSVITQMLEMTLGSHENSTLCLTYPAVW